MLDNFNHQVYAGTSGEKKKRLRESLNFNLEFQRFQERFQNIIGMINEPQESTLHLKNKIFLNEAYSKLLKKNYQHLVTDVFNVNISSVTPGPSAVR